METDEIKWVKLKADQISDIFKSCNNYNFSRWKMAQLNKDYAPQIIKIEVFNDNNKFIFSSDPYMNDEGLLVFSI